MKKSKIEWTDDTYNPIRLASGGFYCFKVSDACTHCYAETMARRVAGFNGCKPEPYTNRTQYPEMSLDRPMLDSWAKKTKPKLNFVSSMTDIFGEFVPESMVFEVLDAMHAASLQTFQVLTKRGQRAYELIIKWLELHNLAKLPKNIWIGVTIEHQKAADTLLGWLLKIPAFTHFVSCEPLLGPIELDDFSFNLKEFGGFPTGINGFTGNDDYLGFQKVLPYVIDWVICGGESGIQKTIRPMHPDWARRLRDQCQKYNVPYFFKQWGRYLPACQAEPVDTTAARVAEFQSPNNPDKMNQYFDLGKHNSGSLLDGVEHKNFPAYATRKN